MTASLSVIVPAYQGARLLPVTLGALAASDLPRDQWQLIVVDDASTDNTAAVAGRWADQVIALVGKPRGPGYARNRGVEASQSDWVVFVDADVRVHSDTLRRIREAIELDPDLDALFGAYDDAPPAPNFLSQYRNLLHRYTHLEGAGHAETFWAGCGAVRRSMFVAIGGFDEARYPRPQIEDIELGCRIRDRSGRIVIRPEVQAAHLKEWHLVGALRTDLFDRGVPWARLLLERRRLTQSAHLNLKRGEQLKVAVVVGALLAVLGGTVTGSGWPVLGGAAGLAGVALSNHVLIRWFARLRGPWFALGVIPWNLLYYLLGGVAVAIAVLIRLRSPSTPTPPMSIAQGNGADKQRATGYQQSSEVVP